MEVALVRTLGWRGIAYAGGLTAIAGFVDGIAFIHFGGYFVSFMSGNSTRSSVDLAEGRVPEWSLAMGLVAVFVLGVMAATLTGSRTTAHRRATVLTVSSLLLLAAACSTAAPGSGIVTALLMAMSMGAMNATYTRSGEVSIGLTYMTGALVKFGQHAAAALSGGSKTAWMPYALLWSMITAGAFGGAFLYTEIGLRSIWVAAMALGLWSAAAWFRDGRSAYGNKPISR